MSQCSFINRLQQARPQRSMHIISRLPNQIGNIIFMHAFCDLLRKPLRPLRVKIK